MDQENRDRYGIDEEMGWRIQVLKRTARTCAAEAKRLEREKNEMRRAEPLEDRRGLEGVLRSIDEVMEWRFVDAMGCVVLDSDVLAQRITVKEVRLIRACVVHAIEGLEGGGR